jgi:hypothetical protein
MSNQPPFNIVGNSAIQRFISTANQINDPFATGGVKMSKNGRFKNVSVFGRGIRGPGTILL